MLPSLAVAASGCWVMEIAVPVGIEVRADHGTGQLGSVAVGRVVFAFHDERGGHVVAAAAFGVERLDVVALVGHERDHVGRGPLAAGELVGTLGRDVAGADRGPLAGIAPAGFVGDELLVGGGFVGAQEEHGRVIAAGEEDVVAGSWGP